MNPLLGVCFFKTDMGNEPVREWLKDFSPSDRKVIGEHIKTVQFGWPLAMPKQNLDLAKERLKTLKRT
jgi:phage-related protein